MNMRDCRVYLRDLDRWIAGDVIEVLPTGHAIVNVLDGCGDLFTKVVHVCMLRNELNS